MEVVSIAGSGIRWDIMWRCQCQCVLDNIKDETWSVCNLTQIHHNYNLIQGRDEWWEPCSKESLQPTAELMHRSESMIYIYGGSINNDLIIVTACYIYQWSTTTQCLMRWREDMITIWSDYVHPVKWDGHKLLTLDNFSKRRKCTNIDGLFLDSLWF